MLGKFLKHCEDSLTAAVISHLLHLPEELFWQILKCATVGDALPLETGRIKEVAYWPKWDSEMTGNANYVEPDVFIRFEKFDLIIEAKRYDGSMQSVYQLENEFQSYNNEYGEEKKKCYILALGGVDNFHTEKIEGCKIIKCRWCDLLSQTQSSIRELRRLQFKQETQTIVCRILEDIVDLFAWHGFPTGLWFSDFNFQNYKLYSGDVSQNTFRNIRGELI